MSEQTNERYPDGVEIKSLLAYLCGVGVSIIPIISMRNILGKYVLSVVVFGTVFVIAFHFLKYFNVLNKKCGRWGGHSLSYCW